MSAAGKVKREEPIYWARLKYEHWALHLAASSEGLCYVETSSLGRSEGIHDSEGEPDERLITWVNKRLPGRELVYNEKKLQPYMAELIEYFAGEHQRQSFSFPLDLLGTPFQVAVWNALRDIPYGETTSYSDIAERIGRPNAVRAVGTAIGSNPILIIVPCHRVIGKNGKLTGFRGGLAMKSSLLKLENAML